MRKLLLAALAVLALAPASANAFTVQEVGGLSSPASGLALGPDGNIWAAEEAAESVVRIAPSGAIVGRIPVAGEPFGVAAGPGGRVWATLPESHELVWFDATAPAPTAHYVSTGAAKCGPAAIADGGNGLMYFTMPFDGVCTIELGHVNADGTGFGSTATTAGNSYDIAISGGKLYTPDFDGDLVRRLGLPALSQEAAINTPPGTGPNGIAADGSGNIWVTLYSSGQLAYFPAAATNGSNATALTPSGGTLAEPFGLVAGGDGKMYVPSGNSQLLAATALPTFAFTPLPAGSEPWEIANGSSGDLWIADAAAARLFHLFDPPPTPPAPPAAVTQPLVKPLPKLSLSGKSKQKLGSFVQLTVSCPNGACSVSATGAMKIKPAGGKRTQPKLKAATVQVPVGKKVALKLKIPPKAREAAAAALATKGGKATAKLSLKAKDANGTSPAAAFKVTLTK